MHLHLNFALHLSFAVMMAFSVNAPAQTQDEGVMNNSPVQNRAPKDGESPYADSINFLGSVEAWQSKKDAFSAAVNEGDIKAAKLAMLNLANVQNEISVLAPICKAHLTAHDATKKPDVSKGAELFVPEWGKLRTALPQAEVIKKEFATALQVAEQQIKALESEALRKSSQIRFQSRAVPTRVVASRIKPRRLQRGLEEGFTVKPDMLQSGLFVSSAGYQLPYRLFLPKEIDSIEAGSLPLVLFVHGNGDEAGTDNLRQFKHPQPLVFVQPERQKDYPCAFVAPQYPRGEVLNTGNPPPYLAAAAEATLQLMEDLEKKHPALNPKRRYGIGLSSGAAGLLDIASRRAGSLAACVVMAGMGGPLQPADSELKTGFWFFYNEEEAPWLIESGETFLKDVAKRGCEARISLAVDQRGHSAWQWALFEPELAPWLFGQRLK